MISFTIAGCQICARRYARASSRVGKYLPSIVPEERPEGELNPEGIQGAIGTVIIPVLVTPILVVPVLIVIVVVVIGGVYDDPPPPPPVFPPLDGIIVQEAPLGVYPEIQVGVFAVSVPEVLVVPSVQENI